MSSAFQEYNHEFAIWTAARASQRAFTTTQIIKDAINESDLNLMNIDFNFDSQSKFDAWHDIICKKLTRSLKKTAPVEKVTYGRVAKIVNIYLKTAYIIPNKGKGRSTKFIHPPIDRILLKNLKIKFPEIGIVKISWTLFEEKDYKDIIERIKKLNFESLWEVEKYWKVE